MRSPRRTAQTASALMVGLALVSAIAVFGASLSRSATQQRRQRDQRRLHHHAAPARLGSGRSATRCRPRRRPCPGSPPRRPSTGASSRSAIRSRASGRDRTEHLSETVILHMTSGTCGALAAGELLIDTTTAELRQPHGGRHRPGEVRADRGSTMRIGGDLQDQRADREATSSATASSSSHFENPLPVAVLLKTDGSPGVSTAVEHALAAYPNVKIQTAVPVRGVAAGAGQPTARSGLRAARPGGDHRPDRDRQHADAVGLRAHPRDRPAARRRHEAPADPGDDPLRVGDPRRVRRGDRHRRRHGAGPRPGRRRCSRRASPTR